MKSLLTLILISSTLFQIPSVQSGVSARNEAAVEEAVVSFFNAMRDADSSTMEDYLATDATLHTMTLSEEGIPMLRQTDIEAFKSSVKGSAPGSLDEQLTSFTVHVDGNLSTAWMDYRFYFNGEFSHCGVNTMNLIQTGAGWKIFSIVDTRRNKAC